VIIIKIWFILWDIFQVDLLKKTSIDGLVITNWEEIIDNIENNKYERRLVKSGCRSFYIKYGNDLDVLERYNNVVSCLLKPEKRLNLSYMI
jgi:hypothetical protein